MDLKILYNMVRATANSASRALDPCNNSTHNFYDYGGYPVFIEQYNEYRKQTIELFGEEAQVLFPPLLPNDWTTPAEEQGIMWRTHLQRVGERLVSLAIYLESKLGDTEERVQAIIDLIEAYLRPSIYNDPEKEEVIQNALENIFRVRSLQYRREKEHIPYSSKTFVPDFTFDPLHLVVEPNFAIETARKKLSLTKLMLIYSRIKRNIKAQFS